MINIIDQPFGEGKEIIMKKVQMIHIILWRYHDGTGSGAINAYREKENAEKELKALKIYGDQTKEFYIEEKELI